MHVQMSSKYPPFFLRGFKSPKSSGQNQKLWNSDTLSFTSCCLETPQTALKRVFNASLLLFHSLPSRMNVWLHFLPRRGCNLALQKSPKPTLNMTQTHAFAAPDCFFQTDSERRNRPLAAALCSSLPRGRERLPLRRSPNS